MPPIAFQGKITFHTFKKAQMVNWGWKKYILLIIPILIVLSSAFAVKPPYSVEAFLPSLAGLIIIPVLFFTTQSTWKKAFKNTPAFKHEFNGTLTETHYNVSSPHGSSSLPWSEFTKATIQEDLILLYQGPAVFQLLSLDMFASKQDWASAENIIKQKVSKRS